MDNSEHIESSEQTESSELVSKSIILVVATHPTAEPIQFTFEEDQDPNDPTYQSLYQKVLEVNRPGHPIQEWSFNGYHSCILSLPSTPQTDIETDEEAPINNVVNIPVSPASQMTMGTLPLQITPQKNFGKEAPINNVVNIPVSPASQMTMGTLPLQITPQKNFGKDVHKNSALDSPNSPASKKTMMSPSIISSTPRSSAGQHSSTVRRRKLPVDNGQKEKMNTAGPKDSTVPLPSGRHVVINNLHTYDEKTFSTFLERLILRRGVDLKGSTYHIGEYNELLSEVTVKFETEEVAQDICSKLHMEEFLFENLHFTRVNINEVQVDTSPPVPKQLHVVFGNLNSYDKKTFSTFLERLILRRGVDLKGSTYHIGEYNELLSEVTVKFETEEVAQDICSKLHMEEFLFEHLQLTQVHISEVQVDTSPPVPKQLHVVFGNLNSYDKKTFSTFLERLILRRGVDLKGSTYHIGEYNELLNEVTVKFETEEVAQDICSKLHMEEFLFEHLQLTQVHISEPLANQSPVRSDGVCSPSSQLSCNSLPEVPTNIVEVYGLPDGFDECVLLHDLNKMMWCAGQCDRLVKPALRILAKNVNSATVEFISIRTASQLCELPGVRYQETIVMVEQRKESSDYDTPGSFKEFSSGFMHDFHNLNIEEPMTEDVLLKHESLKRSQFVLVGNLPPFFTKVEFEKFLLNSMVEASNAEMDESPIERCIMHPKSKSAIVKFSCSEQANLATKLEIEFRSRKLSIKKVLGDVNENEGYSLEDNDEEEEDDFVSVESSVGAKVFLKLTIRFRDDFPKSGSFDATHRDIIGPVMRRMKVCGTVEQMRKKRMSLRNQYRIALRNGQNTHELFVAESVAFDNKPVSILKGTFFEWTQEDEELVSQTASDSEEDREVQDLIKFSEAASWTNNATLALVSACLEHKDDYDKGTRRAQFWRQISNFIFKQKYVYGPEKCKSKMQELLTEYMDYVCEAQRTGAEGPLEMIKDPTTRRVMDLMHELKYLDVTVNPKRVLGAGVTILCKEPTEEVLLAQKAESSVRGRARPTVLKRREASATERKLLLQEKKAEAEVEKAKAMMLISQALMKKTGTSHM